MGKESTNNVDFLKVDVVTGFLIWDLILKSRKEFVLHLSAEDLGRSIKKDLRSNFAINF